MSRVTNITYVINTKKPVRVGSDGDFIAYVVEAQNNWNLQTVYGARVDLEDKNGFSHHGVGCGYYTDFEEAKQIAITESTTVRIEYEREMEEMRKQLDVRKGSE